MSPVVAYAVETRLVELDDNFTVRLNDGQRDSHKQARQTGGSGVCRLLTFFITSVSMTWKTFQGSHTVRYWVRKGARSKLRVSEAPPLASRSNL